MLRAYEYNVSITGIGVDSPFGTKLKDFFENLYQEKRGRCQETEPIPAIGEDARECVLQTCCNAIERAIADWGGDIHGYETVTLIVGSGLGYTDAWSENIAAKDRFLASLVEDIQSRLPFSAEVTYCANACCSASQAICYGADLVGYGFRDLVIAGGADIYSDIAMAGFKRLNALDESGCKPFQDIRHGISIGEGATFFVVEKNKKTKYGYICGHGTTSDAFDIVSMEPEGTYIRSAILHAVSMAGVCRDDIDLIISHGTGTLQNDQIEANAIWSLFGSCSVPPYISAPKAVIGHTGGASGAFGLLIAIAASIYAKIPNAFCLRENLESGSLPVVSIGNQEVSCKYVLVNCFGFGGTNIAIVWRGINGEELY